MASGTGFRVDLSTPDFAQGELAPIIRVVAKNVTNTIDSVVITDTELTGEKSGIKIHMIIMQDPENARKLLSKNSKTTKQKELVEEFSDSSKQYEIGENNSELDAIVDDALKEDSQ